MVSPRRRATGNPERIQIQVTTAQAPQLQLAIGDTFANTEGYVAYDRSLYEVRLVNVTGATSKSGM